MHILPTMYSFIPGGYKPKNSRTSKYKGVLNTGYFCVLVKFFYIYGYVSSLMKCR